MTFNEELIITIVDKGLLSFVALIAGYWIKMAIEEFKANESLKRAVAEKRAPMYLDLWEKTKDFSATRTHQPTDQEKDSLYKEMTDWYYDKGNAIYLSFESSKLFLESRKLLEVSRNSDLKTIKDGFSALRTQMKVDMGVYSPADAKKQLPGP